MLLYLFSLSSILWSLPALVSKTLLLKPFSVKEFPVHHSFFSWIVLCWLLEVKIQGKSRAFRKLWCICVSLWQVENRQVLRSQWTKRNKRSASKCLKEIGTGKELGDGRVMERKPERQSVLSIYSVAYHLLTWSHFIFVTLEDRHVTHIAQSRKWKLRKAK